MNRIAQFFSLSILALGVLASPAMADEPKGFLEGIHKHTTLSTTAIAIGDLNPYAVVVAPVSSGKIQKDDVLIGNFNNISNLQGTGTTIVDYNPTTKQVSLFAKVPKNLPNCPGGIGLTTAMAVLQSGWVIVGSTPSTDGTTRTKGQGCLIVLDNQGKAVNTITSQSINGPWGNMAVIDNGATATLFLSNAGFDIPGPEVIDPNTGFFKIFNTANVIRIEITVPAGKPPIIKSQTVIADGLSARADKDAFMAGPTGLALAPDGTTLYVSDAVNNRIVAVDNAPTRKDSAGTGREIVKGGLLKRPLAMTMTPQGHLLVTNALNGQVVEIDPVAGKTIYAQWIDNDQAQSPPGNGDLFGLAMTPDGKGFYYVEDDMNTLMEAR
jgi:DNA-binding beta-propeller fold protein YncE